MQCEATISVWLWFRLQPCTQTNGQMKPLVVWAGWHTNVQYTRGCNVCSLLLTIHAKHPHIFAQHPYKQAPACLFCSLAFAVAAASAVAMHYASRYLIIGLYVGLTTVWGFLWWYLWYSEGPKLSWKALANFQKCDAATAAAAGYKCEIFSDQHPKTVAMTVLVIVEMFNALNNISENSSLLVIPFWDNKWLLGAIAVSVALHCIIMYVPGLAMLFGITHLNASEWWYVILLSAPVILVDEVLKCLSRRQPSGFAVPTSRRFMGLGGKVASMSHMAVPLSSIQVTSPLLTGGLALDKSH